MPRPLETSPDPTALGLPGLFRPRDLASRGLSPDVVVTWMRRGLIERLDRGVYRVVEQEATDMETIAQVGVAVPHGVVCLLSALRIHEIGTQSPPIVWMAIPRGSRAPRVRAVTVRFVTWSPALMQHGVEPREAQGVSYRVTSPVRTVVDCFRWRRLVGLDVALEALSDAIRSGKVTVAGILRAAEVVRVRGSIEPYLDGILA